MLEIKTLQSSSNHELDQVKTLLYEYGNYMYSELNLIAGKQTYFNDLKNFPMENYLFPVGCFLLGLYNCEPAGCVGIRKFEPTSCEMKRLFVAKKYRGKNIANQLVDSIIIQARNLGYQQMLLDTNEEMKEAIQLYQKFGFENTYAYCENENPNPVYLVKKL